ncbi:bacteriocin-like protein [Chryseobacterium flavum]|uniref:bacteriocin-like protein n=1 Tax=Chryseobacterium flavum TaxID=415851 RepID=UPI0026D2BD67
MKNFKKISRDHLKTIKGGNIEGVCRPGYKYICEATGVCGPEPDAACNCYCIPII